MFDSSQLTQIKRVTLARALCDNGDNINRVQSDELGICRVMHIAPLFPEWMYVSGKNVVEVRPYFTLPHLTSPHLSSPHLTSLHFTLLYFTLFTLSYLVFIFRSMP